MQRWRAIRVRHTFLSQSITLSTLEYGCKYTGELLILWVREREGRVVGWKGSHEIDWPPIQVRKTTPSSSYRGGMSNFDTVVSAIIYVCLPKPADWQFGLFCALWLHFPTATCSKHHVLVCIFSCNTLTSRRLVIMMLVYVSAEVCEVNKWNALFGPDLFSST